MPAVPFPSEMFHGAYPYKDEIAKVADYTVKAQESGALFTNQGAVGAVVFTLPACQAFLCFGFRVRADQSLTVVAAPVDTMEVFNDAAADSVAFSTSGQKIGGEVFIYSNAAGDKWYVANRSAGTNVVTVAT